MCAGMQVLAGHILQVVILPLQAECVPRPSALQCLFVMRSAMVLHGVCCSGFKAFQEIAAVTAALVCTQSCFYSAFVVLARSHADHCQWAACLRVGKGVGWGVEGMMQLLQALLF